MTGQQGDHPGVGWAVLELLGHRRLAGYVSEATVAGVGMLRIDVPADEDGHPAVTQIYAPSAVYCLTPVGEAEARGAARRNRPEPVHRYEPSPPRTVEDRPRELFVASSDIDPADLGDDGDDCGGEDDEGVRGLI